MIWALRTGPTLLLEAATDVTNIETVTSDIQRADPLTSQVSDTELKISHLPIISERASTCILETI